MGMGIKPVKYGIYFKLCVTLVYYNFFFSSTSVLYTVHYIGYFHRVYYKGVSSGL